MVALYRCKIVCASARLDTKAFAALKRSCTPNTSSHGVAMNYCLFRHYLCADPGINFRTRTSISNNLTRPRIQNSLRGTYEESHFGMAATRMLREVLIRFGSDLSDRMPRREPVSDTKHGHIISVQHWHAR